MPSMSKPPAALPRSPQAALVLGAIGIVYGDIGTSPLYAMKEIFAGHHPVALLQSNVLGVLSLVFWSLMVVVSLKYVAFVMRADNHGEGGIMALMALTLRTAQTRPRRRWLLMTLGLAGASLFYGDGVITPAISVLSAVEGLEIATPVCKPFVVPITIAVLALLFFYQRKGTAGIGKLFGPVMVFWFASLAVLGIVSIVQEPDVLRALNPLYAIRFFAAHGAQAFLALGAVVLVLTGAEALYADMGHFGRRPIQLAWFAFVLPALMLNYFGQGALILHHPHAVQNPFYWLVPAWALYPMVALATIATVIASQAVISGAFSITHQAMQLGYAPRFELRHTSEEAIGQIYVPGINWMLLVAVIALVLGFQSSNKLAAAYGIAVTGTMVITTTLAFVVASRLWGWGWFKSTVLLAGFLIVDLAFFGANALKIVDGGWFPVLMGALIFTLMSTWKRGREILLAHLKESAFKLEDFIEGIKIQGPARVPGTAVYMTANTHGVPFSLLHNLMHNKVLHEQVVLLHVFIRDVPWVASRERIHVVALENGFFQVRLEYGFKDEPNIPRDLLLCDVHKLKCDMMMTSFFFGRETLVPSRHPAMPMWRSLLFISMYRNAASAMSFFRIPTNRVVELGTQIEL